jgi:UDP-N-acetylglucosamine 2-epimerase
MPLSALNIVSVIGARPQFIKAAVVSRAFERAGLAEAVVHTGQHYDDAMSGQFLTQLGIDVAANLEVGSGSHAHQTADIMSKFQDFLDSRPRLPDAVVVYGDTNSTIAVGLVASKIGVPLVHIEAGLRSYNRAMPEEVNRVVVDHLSSLLFCSSQVGVENLAREGVTANVHDVGDVMLDAFQFFLEQAREAPAKASPAGAGPFVLATIHRPSNTDCDDRLQLILDNLGTLGVPVIWPVHPRNRARLKTLRVPSPVHCIEPVGYFEMLQLLEGCAAVVTDSGGLQKEAHWARRPCITLRTETEWVETLEGGWNVLADVATDDLAALFARSQTAPWRLIYGDGKASVRIAEGLKDFLRGAG